jgi:hypothetical protein
VSIFVFVDLAGQFRITVSIFVFVDLLDSLGSLCLFLCL